MEKKTPQLDRRDFVKLGAVVSAAAALNGGNFTASAATEKFPPRQFFQPHRIRYDRHSLILDDKPFFMYSGCFHYYRCAKPLWHERFAKIKEAGFNCVQTYVAWNMHEIQMPSGLDDYSKIDLTDLDDWLTMATQEFGLYVSIRPGPYICAEWDTGGFPQWLMTKKPRDYQGEWLRSDDPIFMAWSRHWYNAVCPVIAKHQITRKGPGEPGVMIFQVENEYDYAPFSNSVKQTYVESLVTGALKNGIEVPLFINWGQCVVGAENPLLRRVFDTMDFYPGWGVDGVLGSIEWMRKHQGDAPLMTAELQGGWFSGVGDVPPLRTHVDHYRSDLIPPQINNLTLFCIQNGVTMVNYYMLFGGTNFGGRPGAGIATSYDYSAPIRENGGVGTKYLRVKAIAAMLKEHGPALAQSHAVAVKAKTGFSDVYLAARKAPDGSIYLFIRTDQHGHRRSGKARAAIAGLGTVEFQYELEPFGSKILFLPVGFTSADDGKWLPEPQEDQKRPTNLPSGVTIGSVKSAVDPEPSHWRAIKRNQSLAELGVYVSGFSYYRAKLNLYALPPKISAVALAATLNHSDGATAKVNGEILYAKPGSGTASLYMSRKLLETGQHTATLVYENRGHPNGGIGMEALYGIYDISLVPGNIAGKLINPWRMKEVQQPRNPKHAPFIGANVSTSGWKELTNKDALSATQIKLPNSSAIFRATLPITQEDLTEQKTVLHFSRIDDNGWVFVNGQLLGTTNNWDRAWSFNAEKLLHVGNNTLAVLVQNIGGSGGLGAVKLSSTMALSALSTMVGSLEFAPHPTGVELGWHKPDFNDSNWQQQDLTGRPSDDAKAALLSWHRLEFVLPTVNSGIWLPWCLKIQATGTGFIYVNGHEYGRFWQGGGQREYYLPECWLNTRPGGKNVITLCLRAVDKPAQILAASVEPYVVYAEYRSKRS
ncbi:MAG: beta-galactosidase [Phycisphaerae bacterium]